MFRGLVYCGILGMLLLSLMLPAQTPGEQYLNEPLNNRQLNHDYWEKTVQGIDYSSDEKKVKKKEPTERSYPTERQPPSISFGSGAWSFFAKFILILGAIILIALLLRSLLGYGGFRTKKMPVTKSEASVIDLEKIEENILETDLERYIRQALEQQQYALAIRLYYLNILKELSQLKQIKWKKDKTNRAYLNEMQSSALNPTFRQLTFIFERVWYGANAIDEADFNMLEPQFQAFLQQLNQS
ncbi:MAG: hypothetical protein DHS20C18_01520 [Saprospiraceae bacterium]|nr:MAG: hypothetical protein DHS20C18_01520 [Saprospiraceae bacterium]